MLKTHKIEDSDKRWCVINLNRHFSIKLDTEPQFLQN